MRTVVVALLSAIVGGGIAAGAVLVLDDNAGSGASAPTRTVVRQAPLGRSGSGLTPAEIYKRDAPGVVYISAEIVREQNSPFDLYPTVERGTSTGTGFVIDDRGSIVTNAHVVENARRVTARFADGRSLPAQIKGRDESTDLALLSVDAAGLKLHPLTLGTSRNVQVGDPTVAIGNPFGLDLTLTTGVISAKQRRISAPNGFEIDDVLQTDAAINPGNSGGPLIDAAGRVIGINSQIRTGGQGSEGSIGIGFAVPIDTAKRIVPALRTSGKVSRAYLGVTTGNGPDGAVVQDLVPDGPADKGGIVPTDVITRIGDIPITTADEVGEAVDTLKPGQKVTVQVLRDGKAKALQVTLEQRPNGAALDTVGG